MTIVQNKDEPEGKPLFSQDKIASNIARIEALSARLTSALAQKRPHELALDGPGGELYLKTASGLYAEMLRNPAKLVEQQVDYWGKTLTHYAQAQQAFVQEGFKAPQDPQPQDRRFSNPLWNENPYFNFVKQQYQLQAEAITRTLKSIENLSAKDRQKAEYFTQQLLNLMSPTNFLATNPDALQRAYETEGESLVQGLENLVRDLEENNGEMLVTLADKSAFTLGKNIATSQGSVVYRNAMFELIQYAPSTDKVHKTPLLIFPPWINKFYILDLKPQNSLIKWAVEQGFTVFIVSWVNPDPSYAEIDLDCYIHEGFIRALAEVRRITDEPQVNAVGYCIAGTTLAMTLAHLQKAGDKSVKSATFLTTLTDFSDMGEFGVFLGDDFVDGIERQASQEGILSKYFLQRTFSFLRSNDLIYSPAIRSYMMGEAPPAFDLLYWNGDSTNLPAAMAIDYLRGLCQDNGFAKGLFPVFGKPVNLKDVKVPIFAVACETDHIAAWKASFNGIKQMGSRSKTFVLSQSGHIAGIVNPPSKGKYGHYLNPARVAGDPQSWRDSAQLQAGSWWPLWGEWLAKSSGPRIKARIPHSPLAAAPGTYVLQSPAKA